VSVHDAHTALDVSQKFLTFVAFPGALARFAPEISLVNWLLAGTGPPACQLCGGHVIW
jgi:hypothetical protein